MTLDTLLDWLTSHSGFFTVLGVMGGIGLVGTLLTMVRLVGR